MCRFKIAAKRSELIVHRFTLSTDVELSRFVVVVVMKEPIGVIDLKRCVTDEVELVSRDVCARPNTFELKIVRQQQHGERQTLVTTCYDATSITRSLQ